MSVLSASRVQVSLYAKHNKAYEVKTAWIEQQQWSTT